MESKTTAQSPSEFDSSHLFGVIGERHRLRILRFLMDGAQSVEGIRKHVRIEKTLLSKHLLALKSVGLVRCSRSGRSFEYEINPEIIRPNQKDFIYLDCCEIKLKRI